MSCVWRDIASYLDRSYLPVLFAFVAAGFVLFSWTARLLTAYGRPWWQSNTMTLAERRRFIQWLRDTRRGWIVIAHRLWIAAGVFIMLWPFLSPTFCENMKCSGFSGLKPQTVCPAQAN